jgi:hypothetical protein
MPNELLERTGGIGTFLKLNVTTLHSSMNRSQNEQFAHLTPPDDPQAAFELHHHVVGHLSIRGGVLHVFLWSTPICTTLHDTVQGKCPLCVTFNTLCEGRFPILFYS